MDVKEVMDYLESKGSEQTRKIFLKHGAQQNLYGVKVADLKVLQKKIKINHALAMSLYGTGNSDAQYFAGLIADPKAFSISDFETWALQAEWYMISEYAVAWNIAESPLCMDVCKSWIDSGVEKLEEAAWAALSSHLIVTPNNQLDSEYLLFMLTFVEENIQEAFNRVKYCMNGFVIALGAAFPEYTEICKAVGDRIGKVEVSMGETSCKVPVIKPYLENMESKGRIGKKKKTAKC